MRRRGLSERRALKIVQMSASSLRYAPVPDRGAQEKLQIRRRKRKKVPVAERQPLERPAAANAVWSMDFAFDTGTLGAKSFPLDRRRTALNNVQRQTDDPQSLESVAELVGPSSFDL